MSHDVFISYPSANKALADAICHHLESRGIRCWIAPRDILPGENYAKALYDAIDTSKVFLLVFSENTNNSPHIMSEVQRAFNQNRVIIPFRTENILPSTALQYYIGTAHWLDAITPPLEEKIEKLAETIHKFIGGPHLTLGGSGGEGAGGSVGSGGVGDKPRSPISGKTAGLIVILVMGLILTAVFIPPFLSRSVPPPSGDGQVTYSPPVAMTKAGGTTSVTTVATAPSTGVPDVSGSWTGNIRSRLGGMDYDASMDFTQSGNQILGRFKYWDKNNHLNYVVLSDSGHIENNELFITSSQMVEQGGFLSIKQYNVQMWFDLRNYNSQALSGQWNGEATNYGGTIVLTRKV
jgi:hypothetical protein